MPTPSSIRSTAPPAEPPVPDVLDLSVVIVNYNVRAFLEQALRSLERAQGTLSMEVWVVDNNSVDGSVEMVREQFPDVHVIANDENVGFGRANNQAIRQAKGRYVLVLNPDTIVQEDTLTTLVDFMEAHPEAGAVGCKILNPDGTFAPESRRAFPTPEVAFYRLSGLGRLFPGSRRFGRYNMTYLPEHTVAEVDALSGSCMLVRHAALYRPSPSIAGGDGADAGDGAGLFDEAFFMYGEDLDWCYRIQQAGWRIFYTPETQIIHYKGESTKKGDLRYVRLFYGAMLLFAEKHFRGRYSGAFAALLRLGIVLRAAATVATSWLKRAAQPIGEALLVYGIVAGLGTAYAALSGVAFRPLFYASVAPGFAVSTVFGIALARGYRARRRGRQRPAWLGATLAFFVMATASFFVKDIAFSRLVLLMSLPASGLALSALRVALRRRRPDPAHVPRAVVVGSAPEAERLLGLVRRQPRPVLDLVGYVTPDALPAARSAALPYLGTLRHLRDLARVRGLDAVVFASATLPNHALFRAMRLLRDMPVQCKILAEGREHLIGKASIDDLSTPLLREAEDVVGTPRSAAARRSFEVPVALAGLAAYPIVALLAAAAPRWAPLRDRLRRLPDVLTGARGLVGYDPQRAATPAVTAALPPGVFCVTDVLPPTATAADLEAAYHFYIRNESAALDWGVLWRSTRSLVRPGPPSAT